MVLSGNEGEQTLENFIEEDLPYLIKSHYETTILVIKKRLLSFNSSLDIILFQYPNFLEKIKYQLFFLFAHQMSTKDFNEHDSFYDRYSLVANAYQSYYINNFVETQIQDHKVREIIKASDSLSS